MSNFKTINVAIIGCGKIANKHATILSSKKIKQFNLVAVCDINKKKQKILEKNLILIFLIT